MPPHSYLTGKRIDRARRLLLDGHRPSEVAAIVGFHDQAHLNRHFTRHVGTTPARYQRTRTGSAQTSSLRCRGCSHPASVVPASTITLANPCGPRSRHRVTGGRRKPLRSAARSCDLRRSSQSGWRPAARYIESQQVRAT
ncbi:helix-turn-helix domain-containing protein [Streptomyces halobius]|uniref:helix-turn-helix domain-containing protein n=1 Tax=Streptomyces halobius TaxID=2879846 RepID=UPI0029E81466|nr:helix-turn-helix domain-containing protein [Streptomyces halobius]